MTLQSSNNMEQVHEVLNETVLPYLQLARLHINDFCKSLEAWQIILYTAGLTVVLSWLSDLLFQPESLHVRIKRAVLRLIRKIPAVQRKLQSEILNQEQSCGEGYTKDKKDFSYVTSLPPRGLPLNDLMKEIEKYQKLATVNWSDGKVSGVVYSGAPQLTQLMSQVFGQFAWSNPLHPDVFPDVRKMEAEAVRMACTMFNGGPETCGAMTSGGTESIMLACKAYRDMAYERGVKHPEMVIPVSAHAAFDKSCQYFNIRLVHVPLDDKTMRVDVAAMKRRITKNTIMLVGSAPQFPHGAIDPIEEIAALGLKYNIPVHVDSCLGGFLVPFMRKAGFELAPFDFSVPGVTSISADTHKYGFAPKGSSVILYSNTNYRSYQFFVAPEWQGGIYASQTFGGSRSGAVIAVCWATMMHIGEQGYIDSTRKIITTTRYIQEGLKKIDNIFVFGKPEVSVIAVGTLDFNIYRLSDGLTAKGWNLNSLQNPACFHLCCTLIHTNPGVADMFLRDVRDCMAEIMKDPQADAKGGSAAIYGQAQSIPDKTMLSQVITGYLNAYYSTTMPSPSHNGVNHH